MNMWLALPLTIVLTLILLRLIPGDIKPNIQNQFAIFSNKHTWSMTVLYILTFGSFIGFSAALPLSISVIFGNMMDVAADGTVTRVVNPDAPSALTWAWMGPFVGALIRPVGGWISDKVGGSIVTQIISVVMVAASVATGYVMMLAYNSTDPNAYFAPFLILFIIMVCGQRHRQRFHLPPHRLHLQPAAERPGSGLDLRGCRLRRVHRSPGHGPGNPGRHPGSGHVRICGVLRPLPGG